MDCANAKHVPDPLGCARTPHPAGMRAAPRRPMTHVLFALFDRGDAAANALEQVRRARTKDHPRAQVEVVLHRDHVNSETLPLSSTNGRRRMVYGVLHGLFWGAVFGVILQFLDIAQVRPAMVMTFTIVMGALIGALGGALIGVGSPDEALEHLTTDMGGKNVAITFSTPDSDLFEEAESIFSGNGARIERRAAV
jgi:uncharacterized membrane protein